MTHGPQTKVGFFVEKINNGLKHVSLFPLPQAGTAEASVVRSHL